MRWKRDLEEIQAALAGPLRERLELALARAERTEGDAPPCLRELAELCRRLGRDTSDPLAQNTSDPLGAKPS